MTSLKISAGLSVTLMFAGAALAEVSRAQSINTGGEKGAYHTLFCPPLPDALSNEYFQSYKCTPSKGTLENIDRVLKNPTSLGFVQLDIYANEASKRPEEFKKLTVIRSDIACEGLWMVTKNPALNNYGHILALSRRIPSSCLRRQAVRQRPLPSCRRTTGTASAVCPRRIYITLPTPPQC